MYVMRCMQTEIYIVMVFVGGDAPPKSSAEATRLTRTQQKGEWDVLRKLSWYKFCANKEDEDGLKFKKDLRT